MKKCLLFGTAMLLLAIQAMAAQKLELKEITRGEFRGESMAAVSPMADGETYAQISADGKRIEQYSFKTGKQTGVLLDAEKARGAKIERIEGYIMSPSGKHLLVQTQTKAIYRRSFTATYYIYNIANNKLEPLSKGGPQQTPLWSPDGYQVAFVRDNNIYLVKLLYNNSESQVTKNGKRNEIINGIPDWVNEEEFSFNRSMVFTADSRQIVWVSYDESEVREWTLPLTPADWKAGTAKASPAWGWHDGAFTYKYPKAGDDNSKLSLMSYDIKSHQTRTLQLPLDADGYIPRIVMTSDSSKIAVLTLNRHQDCLRVYMANPLSTVCQMVIEDKVDKYINENVFANLRVTTNNIVLTSERTGRNTLYLYGLNGMLRRTVNSGIVNEVYGYDEATGDLYFSAYADNAQNVKVFVSRKNGKTDCLTPRDGWNTATFSADFKYFIHTWSDLNTPAVTAICTNAGKAVKTLIDNEALTRKLQAYDLGQKELFTFKTSEGIELAGWLVKPVGFNPQKKYPVIMYQYGGPGSQQVKNAWGIGMNGQGAILEQYLAERGYIVACVDNRGTGGRGAEFEKCIYQRLGELEARDQVEAAIWLGKQSFVDKDHIGIWGWSYGGWNTLMSMSEGRPVFAAGVAIAPPTCWRYYDTIYTERFMRTPKENASGYDEVNPIVRAGKLHGALLICHGLSDDNVHYQNTADYVEALVQADKDFRQLVYTNRNHSIFGGNTRNHLFRQCFSFFDEHLR
jgi:dipeptidyl-peptidase-4